MLPPGRNPDRSVAQQRYRASGLDKVTAAVVLWNTVCLERAAHALRGNAHTVDEALLQHLSPLGCEHINLTDDDLWRSSAKIGTGMLSPLRSPQPAWRALFSVSGDDRIKSDTAR